METHPRELAPPLDDPKATEIARVWGSSDGEYVSLNPHLYPDPASWGLMLVDLVRHVANALQQSRRMDARKAEREIRRSFDNCWRRSGGESGGLYLAEQARSPLD
jgi:hypothetical protein